MRKAAFCTILFSVGMFLLGALPAAAASAYTCKDLGVNTGANALNQAGQVVGSAGTSSGDRAFLYSGGILHNLGTLPAPHDYASYALGLNAAGQVAGYSASSSPNDMHAFLWSSSGGMTDLGTLPGGSGSYATGINANGQTVGSAQSSSGYSHAFLWNSSSGMTDLGGFPGCPTVISGATGINTAGQVVGWARTAAGANHAFLYSGGFMQDLDTLPGGNVSQAVAINDAGQVAGYSQTAAKTTHAFLYSGGMTDLGTLPTPYNYASYASGLNGAGQVVGYCYSSSYDVRAFLYHDGGMLDLTSLVTNLPAGVNLTNAAGINDQGQIVANGNNGHAYLLSLKGPPPPAVVVPPLLLLLLE